jgi:serine protease AprX
VKTTSVRLKKTSVATALALGFSGLVGGLTFSLPGVAWSACEGTAIDTQTATMATAAEAINAPAAWAAGLTGAGVDVALIDTGVTAVPGLSSSGKIVDAADFSFDSANPALSYRDGEGHGTNMAGIIAGDGSGGPLTTGIAPGARIINVRAGASDGSVDVSQVVAALDWTVQNRKALGRNIRVINLSFTTDASTDYLFDPLTLAVENAWNSGIVVVVSAGNDGKGSLGRLGNPAADPFVIAVGAAAYDRVTRTAAVPDWSAVGNLRRNPDFVAPGVALAGLRVPGSMLDSNFPRARYFDPSTCTSFFRGSGTSQAAAVTSGAVALMLQQRPSLTPDHVKRILATTARRTGASSTKEGAGLIDLAAALALQTPDIRIVSQRFARAMGTGSLEASRGSSHIKNPKTSQEHKGEATLSGMFDSRSWSVASTKNTAWTNQLFDAQGRFLSGTWSGSSWSGSSWSGSSWSGSSWSGSSWSGSSWSGSSWSGSSWSGNSWA